MEHITNEELLSLKIQEIIVKHSSIKNEDVKICKVDGKIAVEYEFNTEELRKDIEKEIRKGIEQDIVKLLTDPEPTWDEMVANVGTKQHYIRGVTHDLTKHHYDI